MTTSGHPARDYQQTLAARRAIDDQNEQGASRLGMQLGESLWLLDLSDVSEVIPVPEVLPVPLTKPWYAGIANIRGDLVSVIDFCLYSGGPPVTPSERARLVVVAEKHRINCALLFSRVIGLRQFDRFERAPDEARQPSWIEGRYLDQEQQRWNLLLMHALVTHPDFLRVELALH